MLKVLIVDDHPIVRQGLRQILKETSDIVVTGEASSGAEVFDAVSKDAYDLVLLDISMPGQSGVETLRQLKHIHPSIKVLILSTYPEEQYAVRALKDGAAGYLTKQSAPDELIMAIRKVSLGGKYVSMSLAEKLAFALDEGTPKHPHEKLSDREYEVMCRIASGKTIKEIAKEFSLSVKTVSTYRARILDKMSMKTNAELTHYAIKEGLVS